MNRNGVVASVVLALTLVASLSYGQERPLLAVMDIRDKSDSMEQRLLDSLTEYLRGLLTESGAYTVVDRSRQADAVKEMIRKERKESYKGCYDRSCQVPLGRALAADRILVTSILKIGSHYMVKTEIIDLATEASAGGATIRLSATPPGNLEDRLVTSLDAVAARLSGGAHKGTKLNSVVPPVVQAERVTPARRNPRTSTEWFDLQASITGFDIGVGVNGAALRFRWEHFYVTLLQGSWWGQSGGNIFSSGSAVGYPLHLGSSGRHEIRFESDVEFWLRMAPEDEEQGGDSGKYFEGFGLTPRILYVYHLASHFTVVGGIEMYTPLIQYLGNMRYFLMGATAGVIF